MSRPSEDILAALRKQPSTYDMCISQIEGYYPDNDFAFIKVVNVITMHLHFTAAEIATDLDFQEADVTKWLKTGVLHGTKNRVKVQSYLLKRLRGQWCL